MTQPKNSLRDRFKSIMKLFNDRTSKRDDSIRLELLEPRVMFDASPLAAAIQEIGDADVHAVDLEVAADLQHLTFSSSTDDHTLADAVDRMNDLASDIDHAIDLLSALSLNDESNGILETANSIFDVGLAFDGHAHDPAASELIVIDSHVDGYDQLLADLENQIAAGRNLDILLLDASQDGMSQITDFLLQFDRVDSLQIISHGGETGFQLGSSWITGDDLGHYSEQLSQWQTVLSDSADILIYGCNLAASETGQSLLNELAHLTGADVAASDDLTGHADLGGDWDLEYSVGTIDVGLAFTTSAAKSWYSVLDISSGLVLHNTFDANANDSSGNNYDGTLTNGAVIDTNSGTNKIGPGKLSLDGTNDYVDFSAHASNFQGLTEGTISAWVYANSDRDVIFEMSDSGDADSRLALFRDADGSFDVYIREGSTTLLDVSTAAGAIAANTWTHVAVTVDASGNKLFVNGVQQGGLTYAVGSSTTNRFFDDVTQLDFGSWGVDKYNGSSFVRYFNGLLDDGRVYNRALSNNDISELYSYPVVAIATSFQDGNGNGYNSTIDTFVDQLNPNNNNSVATTLQVDLNDGANDTAQSLIRFDNIFGTGTGQIPYNVYITSATLSVNVTNLSSSGATISMHEMLTSWTDTSTWNSMSGGISLNNVEAATTADSILANPAVTGSVTFTGLEDRIQSWIDGASTNNGWVINSNNTNGWDFDSSEGSIKPVLTVSYVLPGSQASTVHTLTVDTANDVMDGDATSIDTLLASKGADGKISLREAIWAANNTTNFDASTADVINFAIGVGGSAQTIFVNAGGLPTITDALVLDASTQGANQLITLDGTNAVNSTGGIVLRTNDSIVRGFNVINFPDEGIEIDGSTGFGDNNIIEYNWVGINAAGSAAGKRRRRHSDYPKTPTTTSSATTSSVPTARTAS